MPDQPRPTGPIGLPPEVQQAWEERQKEYQRRMKELSDPNQPTESQEVLAKLLKPRTI